MSIPSVGPGAQEPLPPSSSKKSGIVGFVLNKLFGGQRPAKALEAKPMQAELISRPTLENFKNAWAVNDSSGAYSLLCKMDKEAKIATYIYLIEQGAYVANFAQFEADPEIRKTLLPNIIEKCKTLPQEKISKFVEAWNLSSSEKVEVCKALIDAGQTDKAVAFGKTLHRRSDICKHLIDKKQFREVFQLLQKVQIGNDYGDVCLHLLQNKENLSDEVVLRNIDSLLKKSIPSTEILESLIKVDQLDRAVRYISNHKQLKNQDAYLTAICLKYVELWPDHAATMICDILPYIKNEKNLFKIYEALAANNKQETLTYIADGLMRRVGESESKFEQLVLGKESAQQTEYRNHGFTRRETFNSIAIRYDQEIASLVGSLSQDFRCLDKIFSITTNQESLKSRLDSLKYQHDLSVQKWNNPKVS